MWLPRLSLLTILGLFAVLGVFLAVLAWGVRGNQPALAVSVAVGSLLLAAGVYCVFFLAALLLSTLLGLYRGKQTPGSPFATQTPPPQIISPDDAL